jgi:hypothetical protein
VLGTDFYCNCHRSDHTCGPQSQKTAGLIPLH